MTAIKEALLSAAGTAFILLMAVLYFGSLAAATVLTAFKFPWLLPAWIFLLYWMLRS